MPFIELRDFMMHYEITGDGPETILLVHGNIASTRWWDKYLPRMPHGYRAVAMDLRGCGLSAQPRSGYTIEQFASDIHCLIIELGLNKFHLIGHSMGGQIAMYHTLQHLQLVQTLTLLNSVPADGLALDDTARANFDLLMTDKAALQQAVDACMPYSNDRQFAVQSCEQAFSCAPNIFKDNPETMHQTVLIDKISGIKAPTLIIHGRQDLIIPLAAMERTIEAMPNATTVIFEECGHSPQIERPADFSEVFNKHIQQYPID